MDFSLNLKHFSDVGLSAQELYPGIFVVNNFLKAYEIEQLELQFARMTDADWSRQYTESLYEFIKNQYGVSTIEEARALGHDIKIDPKWVDKNALIEDQSVSGSINQRLHSIFSKIPGLDLQGVGSIQRQYEGVSLSYHVDSLSNPAVVFANVMYVNDDFIDGELHFPKIDITFKPKKGDLIVFPSDDDYLHGVRPVGKGPVRYALPAFVNRVEVGE